MILLKNILEVRHILRGRIRFKVYPIRRSQNAASWIIGQLQEKTGILQADANPKSASLIVRYNASLVTQQEILDLVTVTCREQQASTMPAQAASAPPALPSSVKGTFWHFLTMSAVMLAIFVREVILKRPFVQTLWSPLGIISLVSALPLVKKGVQRLKEGRVTLESFLGGSLIAATVAGEAVTALEILWISSGASLLQAWITERSRRAIRDILQVTEHQAFLFVNGVEVEVPIAQIKQGDVVVYHTGEKISVDGVLTDGHALIDESPINGRAETMLRQAGDTVYAGTFVSHGVIYVRAEQIGDRTYLARILRMVEDSLENKSPIEGVADRLAKNLVTLGGWTTVGTFLITGSAWRAFSVLLVMACPCATILAASTAISAAISVAAKRGILVKGGRYLEEIGKANVACFDKTGTLTTTEPEIQQVICLNGLSQKALLQLAYSVEKHNFHPLAEAIKARAQSQQIEAIPHEVCEYHIGKGVRAEIHGREILVGSRKLMDQFGVATDLAQRTLQELQHDHLTTVFITRDKDVLGMIGFANRERSYTKGVLDYLHGHGVQETLMVTGDEESTAKELATRLGMTHYHASVMPEEKFEIVSHLKGKGRKVMMVGDGINDALALAEADIGVAMGAAGSEVAIEAADIALVNDDLHGIVYIHALSQQTLRVVRQNFWIATGSNIVGAALGALGMLSPVMAGLLHIAHTAGVLANSSRLLMFAPPEIRERTE